MRDDSRNKLLIIKNCKNLFRSFLSPITRFISLFFLSFTAQPNAGMVYHTIKG